MKKIVSARIKDLSSESKVKLLELYKYASLNEVDTVVLFTNGLLREDVTLFDVVDAIPKLESKINTCLFLGTEDIYSLSPNAFNMALKDRTDININLDGYSYVKIGDKTINFFNDLSQFEMSEDDLKGICSEDNINVYSSRNVHGSDRQTFLSGRTKIFVGPSNASLFEESDSSIIYSDLTQDYHGFVSSCDHVVFSKGKEYVKKK